MHISADRFRDGRVYPFHEGFRNTCRVQAFVHFMAIFLSTFGTIKQ